MVLALAAQDTDLFAGIGAHADCRSTNSEEIGPSWTTGFLQYFRGKFRGLSGVHLWGASLCRTQWMEALRSDETGRKLEPGNAGIAESGVLSMVSDGTNLYAGTGPNSGVYVFTNNGTSWRNVRADLPTGYAINTLAVQGPYLFAGLWNPRTGGAGVWRRPCRKSSRWTG